MEAAGGSITVTMSGEVGATVSAEAVGGRVTSELPVTVQGKVQRDSLQGTINGGGPRLELATTAGSITIKKRR